MKRGRRGGVQLSGWLYRGEMDRRVGEGWEVCVYNPVKERELCDLRNMSHVILAVHQLRATP